VTPFNWGEYAIWHLAPRLRVSMDGRRETIYSDLRLAESDAVMSGSPDGLAALAAWKAEYVWVPAKNDAILNWLSAHGYRLDVRTRQSIVAVRSDLPVLPSSPPAPACFPG
jgi:hypothetical protein